MPVRTQHRATPAEGADDGSEVQAPGSGPRGDDTVARALRLIEEGFLTDRPLAALAARVEVSERHLRRLFLRRFGVTPPDVHRARRLCVARRLLTETSLPIIEVALEAGFGSVRRFNACFREAYGMAPRDMRHEAGAFRMAPPPRRPRGERALAAVARLGTDASAARYHPRRSKEKRMTKEARGRRLMAGLLLGLFVLTFPAIAAAEETPPGAPPGAESPPAVYDGSRDFDFEFGEWKIRLSRLARPLSGSTEWIEYEGTSVVRKVWDGRANLGELEVDGPDGHIQGLSLRLYDPESRQWRIHWASSRDGAVGEAMVGGFRDGIGEFYNQEEFDGRSIFVRFLFTDLTPTSFRLEQAFSADGGKTWEPNWIARFSR